MAYDSMRNQTVLFGGFTEQLYFNDLWAYDATENAWREILPNTSKPEPRGAMGFAYDEQNDVFVMYGGFSESGIFGDTWVLDRKTNRWENKDPEMHPPPVRTRMIYDNATGQSIFFGGDVTDPQSDEAAVSPYDAVWAYDYRTNSWQELATGAPTSPASRSLNGIAFDSIGSSVIIFGGTDALIDSDNLAGREFGDMWTLSRTTEESAEFDVTQPMIVIPLVLIAGGGLGALFVLGRRRGKSKS
jgi:N-acetylneuraminic acid mutarotase